MLGASGTRLFGRADELAEISRLLSSDNVRLLTLTGPGGTGKTRLAESVATGALPAGLGSVSYTDLAAVDDHADVAAAIAATLGIQESGSAPPKTILRDAIGQQPLLLVLDNFEHLLGAACVISELLAAASQLKCLVTSREPLHIRAEHVLQVQPLTLPDPSDSEVEVIARSPAVALFVDCARAHWSEFTLDAGNAATVASICRRLDGLPLAIELASAQIGILSPQAVLTRLESDLPFIVDGARDSPPRHRSLGAAVSWSYGLLEPQMQLVFRRCGVFNGSFDVAAAAAVIDAPGGGDPLAMLAQLVEKNLIRMVQPAADEPRFRLLETIRSFAVEMLDTCGELAETRRRHAGYFVDLAEGAEPALVGPAMGETLDRLEREYDNFRAVLTWSAESGELEPGLRVAGALNRFWMMRGRLSEARHWLERALPLGATLGASIRAKAYNTAGVLSGLQGDAAAAEPFFLESYRLWEQVGDTIRMAAATGNLGLVAQDRQDDAGALECFARAQALYAQAGDRRGVAISIGSRAHLARQQGQTLESVRLFEETLVVFREVGDPRGIANCLANFAHALIALGRPRDAIPHLVECLELRRSLGNTLAVAECLEGFAAVAMAQRQARRAARLLGAAAVLREMTGAPPTLVERRQQELVVQRIQEALTPAGLVREEALGRAMNLDEAVTYALDRSAPAARKLVLSERELEVARLVARGLTNGQAAEVLSLTRRTVATHLEHIFAKLGLQTRAELAAWIVRYELDELQPRGHDLAVRNR